MCCGSDAARPPCGAAARASSIIFCHSCASVQVSDSHLSCHSSMALLSGVTSFPLMNANPVQFPVRTWLGISSFMWLSVWLVCFLSCLVSFVSILLVRFSFFSFFPFSLTSHNAYYVHQVGAYKARCLASPKNGV